MPKKQPSNSSLFTPGPPLGNTQTPDSYLRIKQNIDGITEGIDALTKLLTAPQSLTPAQLAQAQKALQAGGDNPLNLTNLIGTVAGAVASLNGLVKAIQLVAGAGISVGVSGQNISVGITPTGVTAGTYAPPHSISVNAEGQITAIS